MRRARAGQTLPHSLKNTVNCTTSIAMRRVRRPKSTHLSNKSICGCRRALFWAFSPPSPFDETMLDQVENIFLNAASCPDGDYKYFVRYYSGHGKPVDFTVVFNQFGTKIDEGSSKVKSSPDTSSSWSGGGDMTKKDVHCLTLTMKKGKVANAKFHIKTKDVPLE